MKAVAATMLLLLPVVVEARTPMSKACFNENAAMTDIVSMTAVDHTGFAVSSLDEAIRFWTVALGLALERQSEMGGDFLRQVTGVDDPSVRTAIVKARTICCRVAAILQGPSEWICAG